MIGAPLNTGGGPIDVDTLVIGSSLGSQSAVDLTHCGAMGLGDINTVRLDNTTDLPNSTLNIGSVGRFEFPALVNITQGVAALSSGVDETVIDMSALTAAAGAQFNFNNADGHVLSDLLVPLLASLTSCTFNLASQVSLNEFVLNALTAIDGTLLDFHDMQLVNDPIPAVTMVTGPCNINLAGNSLPYSVIDQILQRMDQSGMTSGTLALEGGTNGAPSLPATGATILSGGTGYGADALRGRNVGTSDWFNVAQLVVDESGMITGLDFGAFSSVSFQAGAFEWDINTLAGSGANFEFTFGTNPNVANLQGRSVIVTNNT